MSERLFSLGPVEQLADDEVVGICISGGIKRDGDEWVPSGVDLTAYRANPVVLRQHDPDHVVGSAIAIGPLNGNEIGVRIRFAPPGVCDIADETRGLVKAGVLRGISAGVAPIEVEPLDPRKPYGNVRILKAELLEVSFVPIPADTAARVTARSFASRPGIAALLRSLPPIPGSAVERALTHVARKHTVPFAYLPPREQFEADRQRTMAAWALQQAAQAQNAAYSGEQRQTHLQRLRGAFPCDPQPQPAAPRRRLRPYGL
jgi:HK97 family phage prohead protease